MAVTSYNNVVDGGSDSDDEDKLHIVEEDGGVADGTECDSMLPEDEHRGGHCWDGGKIIIFTLKHAHPRHTSWVFSRMKKDQVEWQVA